MLCPSTAGCNPPLMPSIVVCLKLSCSAWFPPHLLYHPAACLVVLWVFSLSRVAVAARVMLSCSKGVLALLAISSCHLVHGSSSGSSPSPGLPLLSVRCCPVPGGRGVGGWGGVWGVPSSLAISSCHLLGRPLGFFPLSPVAISVCVMLFCSTGVPFSFAISSCHLLDRPLGFLPSLQLPLLPVRCCPVPMGSLLLMYIILSPAWSSSGSSLSPVAIAVCVMLSCSRGRGGGGGGEGGSLPSWLYHSATCLIVLWFFPLSPAAIAICVTLPCCRGFPPS